MRGLFLCVVAIVGISSFGGPALSQIHNTAPWPTNPPVGIATDTASTMRALNAFHIHYNPSDTIHSRPAIIRLSEGPNPSSGLFGILGLMPNRDTTFTSLANHEDLVLHEHAGGDIIITNWSADTATGSIRFGTTGNLNLRPTTASGRHDLERMTIAGNGNVGIDIPTTGSNPLCRPLEQVQIGGGSTAPSWSTSPLPGLSIYGGNRDEGMPRPGGGVFPYDSRNIAYNQYINHADTSSGRFKRMAPMSSSDVVYSEGAGGIVQIDCNPYDSARGQNDFRRGVHLMVSGRNGMEFWSDENDSDAFHHLLELWRPGFTQWNNPRNVNGLCMIHTPVSIDTSQYHSDFTDLVNVHPDLGDGKTWMLAVNGSALFKEAVVNSNDWPDYVFDSSYHLASLGEVESYAKVHHHLPGIASADSIAKTGVSLGGTEVILLQKIEELTLYSIEQNKRIEKQNDRIEALEAQISDLAKRGK